MKETLVFLHGWGGTKNSLLELSKHFENDGYQTIVLEMPGHGETKEMDTAWNMDKFSSWAKDQIGQKAQDINNIILIGHSFGGKIILELVSSKKLNPKSIVLINSNGVKPKNSIKKKIFKALSTLYHPFEEISIFKNLRILIYKFIIREKDYLNSKSKLKESFKLFNEEHYNDKLDNIDVDTLIIWGSNDKVTPLWMGKFLKSKLKKSKLEIVEDTHGLPLKQPGTVYKLIRKFIQNG